MGKPRKGVRKVTHRSGRSTWQARWYDPTGKRRPKNFDTAREAEAWLDAVQAAKRRNEYHLVVPPEITTSVGELVEQVEARRRNRSEVTRKRDTTILNNQVLPHLGDLPLTVVTDDTIEDWVEALIEQGYANDTIRRAFQMVSRTFAYAEQKGLVRQSPVRPVKLPKKEKPEQRVLTVDEIWTLAEAIDRPYRAMVLLGGFAGLRWQEAAGLKVNCLDLTNRTLKVVECLRRDRTLGPPKSKTSRRTIVLSQFLIPEIATHLREHPPGDQGLLFTTRTGNPLLYPHWRQRKWLPAVRSSVGEPLTFHRLRHSHATLLVEGGVNVGEVQSRLGHADARITLEIYTHVRDGMNHASADFLDTQIGGEGDATGTHRVAEVLPIRR